MREAEFYPEAEDPAETRRHWQTFTAPMLKVRATALDPNSAIASHMVKYANPESLGVALIGYDAGAKGVAAAILANEEIANERDRGLAWEAKQVLGLQEPETLGDRSAYQNTPTNYSN